MKTKRSPANTANKKASQTLNAPRKGEELHTDFPLSEKDEVKQAEKRTNKPIRHHL